MKSIPPIIIYAVCFGVMFFLTWICKREKSNKLFDAKGRMAVNTSNLLGLHFAGIGWWGIVPITLFYQSFESTLYNNGLRSNSIVLIMLFLLLVIGLSGYKVGCKIQISQINIYSVSTVFLFQYFLARIFFLCSYELFFRGFLLFECIQMFGVFLAIAACTGLTVLIHVFTNKKEMWACIPFGIVLSICCIFLNAVWPAIVLHIVLSLAYEIPPVCHFLTQLKPIK